MTVILDIIAEDDTSSTYPGGIDDYEDICSVLAPIVIDGSVISSITAGGAELPEDSRPQWSQSATYDAGDQVYLGYRTYESVKGSNAGKDPSVLSNQYSASGTATWWIDIGPTNRSAVFDSFISTPTVAPSPLVFTLEPGAFNGVAMFGLDADRLQITVKSTPGGDSVYVYDEPLDASSPTDYYDYFFGKFNPQTQFIATGIDPYGSSEITITLIKGSGDVKVGMIAIGDMRPLGVPLKGASVEPVDYSYVSTDQFGNTTVRKRTNATGMSISAKMNIEDANTVLDTVKELLGEPVVVVGSTAKMYEALTVFGLLSARQQYDDFGMPTINMTIKGLI